jgi:hypothetical protein
MLGFLIVLALDKQFQLSGTKLFLVLLVLQLRHCDYGEHDGCPRRRSRPPTAGILLGQRLDALTKPGTVSLEPEGASPRDSQT